MELQRRNPFSAFPSLPDAWGDSQKPLRLAATILRVALAAASGSLRETGAHPAPCLKTYGNMWRPKELKQKSEDRSLEPRENKSTAAESDAHSTKYKVKSNVELPGSHGKEENKMNSV